MNSDNYDTIRGAGTSPNNAESLRRYLRQEEILNPKFRVIKKGQYIFFPLIEESEKQIEEFIGRVTWAPRRPLNLSGHRLSLASAGRAVRPGAHHSGAGGGRWE